MADFSSGDKPDDTMFQDAVEALRSGDKPRAKELLTLLLKADQNNPTYWIWLSASVDNAKERIYCLQTALKLDPQNGTAKRGLILLGALTPDEAIQPFPMNRPRAWEEKLLLANEKPKEKGFKALVKNPAARLAGVALIVVGLCAAVVFGFVLPRQSNLRLPDTNTPGPSPTFTATPTVFGATAAPTKSFVGPTPLWMLLPQTYTPTALYVNTQRPPQSRDQYRSAKIAYDNGDWDAFISNMELIIPLEPESADVPYLIGEAYRFKGEASNALKAYNRALEVDPNFGPAYLGLARARLMSDPGARVETLFDQAIKLDPNFGDIYLERARYFLNKKDPEAAIEDLDTAVKIMPGSAEAYMLYAEAYIALEDEKKALTAAEKAYSLDITALPVYPLLGKLYIDNGKYQQAIDALDLYTVYETEDATAFAMLGQAYFELKDYKLTVENLDKAYAINPSGQKRYYVYRGLANLELNNIDQAVEDLEKAYEVDETSFEINFALMRTYFLQEKFGTAYLKAEALKALAKTDEQTALALYWHALIQEKREETESAVKDWQELLAMDPDVMTPEMRDEAEKHLKTLVTATNTSKPAKATSTPKGGTATVTPTPRVSVTPSKTPRGGTLTATPTSRLVNSPTPKVITTPTRTPTPTPTP